MKLNKLVLALVTVAMFAFSVSALNVGLDIKGALNMSKVRFSEDLPDGMSNNMLLNTAAGAAVRLQIVDAFTIQPELLYSVKGSTLEMEEEEQGVSVKMTSKGIASYLEIPVLFKYNIPASETIIPSVYAGPALGILLSAKQKTTASAAGIELNDEQDVKDETNTVDFGVAFGADLGIKAGPGRIILDARYTLGLMDVSKEAEEGSREEEPTIKNGSISIFAGYGFDF